MDERYMTIKKIFFEAINKDSKLTLKDLKNILELEFIKNDLDKIKVCDIYNIDSKNDNFNINEIDEILLQNKEIDKNIENEDKEYIKNVILKFMDYNIKYKFSEIKNHINIIFKKYKIKDNSILGLMLQMKNKNIIIYESGKWMSNC